MSDQEKKPFWGPHRMLYTMVLLRSVVTSVVSSVVLWCVDCSEPMDPVLCRYEPVNYYIALVAMIPFNYIYYLYKYADMSFGGKVAFYLTNFFMSAWILVVLFAIVPRLCIETVQSGLDKEVVATVGILYVSYAFVVQLSYLGSGLLSLAVSCLAVVTRKPPQAYSINEEKMRYMQDRLQALQRSREHTDNQL